MIRELCAEDIAICADLLQQAYNNKYWNCQWRTDTATRYLLEFLEAPAFVGFVLEEQNTVVGSIFCHRKTWWTNDELYIDEFFVHPSYQRKGYGKSLLNHVEKYCVDNGLAGLSLLTNKYAPAKQFYEKQNYTLAEHVIYFYKEV